jgi:hypothetical protein
MASGPRKHVLAVTVIISSHYHHGVFLLHQFDRDLCDGELRSHEAPAVCVVALVSGGQEANAVDVVCGVSYGRYVSGNVLSLRRTPVLYPVIVCISGLLIQLWKQGDICRLWQQSIGYPNRNIAVGTDFAWISLMPKQQPGDVRAFVS